tara:strand:+ start:216 stop:440 length:225 start_codon:yes stop_codon:yes gene_type:complete
LRYKGFWSININKNLSSLKELEMLESLDPFQQLLLGVTSVGVLMILLVIFLTASPNFENTDRLKKILDFFEKKN